jgi:hypothetical protein
MQREKMAPKSIQTQMDSSSRERKRPQNFYSYVELMSNIIDSEPSTYEDFEKKQVWKDVMMEKYQSIMKNDVWEVVLRPKGKSLVTSKWIYKIKHVVYDNIDKYKDIFVARGFSQKEGEYYDNIFSLVARRSVHREATRFCDLCEGVPCL